MESPVLFLFESLFFWVLVSVLVGSIFLFWKNYKKAYSFEMKVHQGWNDMIHRSERLFRKLDEIQDELDEIKKDREDFLEKFQEILIYFENQKNQTVEKTEELKTKKVRKPKNDEVI